MISVTNMCLIKKLQDMTTEVKLFLQTMNTNPQSVTSIPASTSISSSTSNLVNDDEETVQREIFACCEFAVKMKNISVFETLYHEIKNSEIYSSALFHEACDNGCLEIMQILLRHGTSINQFHPDLGEELDNPLLFTVQKGNANVVRFLCSYANLDKTIVNKYEMTVAMLAAKNENSACLDILIQSGCDVTRCDKSGNTALHHVCYDLQRSKKSNECVKMLLKAGCDVNVKNNYGDTAIQIAEERHHFEIAKLLICENCRLSSSEFRTIPFLKPLCTGNAYTIVRRGSLYHFDGDAWSFKGNVSEDDSCDDCEKKIPIAFGSLRDACRFEIRKSLGSDICKKLSKLSLPRVIKDFIMLKDVIQDDCFL